MILKIKGFKLFIGEKMLICVVVFAYWSVIVVEISTTICYVIGNRVDIKFCNRVDISTK